MLLNNKLTELSSGPIAAAGAEASGRARPRLTTFPILHLLRELIKRDFNARFAGSALGLTWSVVQPLSLVVLYWFVFTFMIPGGRAGQPGESYTFFLISGLIPWLGFNEGLVRSTTAIVENAPLVRRLPLRSEVLVAVPNASALIFECVGLAIFVIAVIVRGEAVRLLWLLPFALTIQVVLQFGVGLFLAALYVLFRDLAQIIAFLLSILFYLSPILYPASGRFEKFLLWNPLTPLLGLFRSAMLGSPLPQAGSIVFLLIFTASVLASGLLFFRRAQPTLVDLI
jgi:lipopolysaccharide transport system permease protein